MKIIFNGKNIEREDLLEENLEFLKNEYPEFDDNKLAIELEKMIRDTSAYGFETDIEEENYSRWVNLIDYEYFVTREEHKINHIEYLQDDER